MTAPPPPEDGRTDGISAAAAAAPDDADVDGVRRGCSNGVGRLLFECFFIYSKGLSF
jgi:hypothetical protein